MSHGVSFLKHVFLFLIAAKIQAKIQKHSEDCGQEEPIEERSAKEHFA